MILHGGRQFLPVHQETAVTGTGDHHAVWMQDFRGHRSRHTVTHGAAGRTKQRRKAAIGIEAVQPGGIIARAIGHDRIRRQMIAEPGENVGGIDASGRGHRLRPIFAHRARFRSPLLPVRLNGETCRFTQERPDTRQDRQIGLIDTVQFIRTRMNMYQRLSRRRHRQPGIAGCGHFAEARAHNDEKITVANMADQTRIGPDAKVATEIRMRVVETILGAERSTDRQIRALGENACILYRLPVPAGAAQHQKRTFRLQEPRTKIRHVGGGRRRFGFHIRPRIARFADGGQHIFRQGQHHRAGPAGGRGVKGPRDIFRDAVGIADFRRPFRQRREHGAEIDFLKRLAIQHGLIGLPDEKDHRR